MRSQKRAQSQNKPRKAAIPTRIGSHKGGAPDHEALKNQTVHAFVDDQNLFWGIVNHERGIGYRIDFGKLMLKTGQNSAGDQRGIRTAFIAGVIPDDDDFWKVAES